MSKEELMIMQDAMIQLDNFYVEFDLDMETIYDTYNEICIYYDKKVADWNDVYNYMIDVF